MRALTLAAVIAVLLASGCERRKDYLEPQSDNAVMRNFGRVATVIMPLGSAANVLISEMVRDANALNRGEKLETYGSQSDATPQ